MVVQIDDCFDILIGTVEKHLFQNNQTRKSLSWIQTAALMQNVSAFVPLLKVIFNLSQFFCFLFRTTDKMTQFYKPFWDVCSTFWCIQWEKTVFSLRQLPSVFLYPWLWKSSSTSILLWSSRVNHCLLFVGYWLFE